MKIKIIAIPPDNAPPNIAAKWLNVEMECLQPGDNLYDAVFHRFYQVTCQEVLRCLKEHDREAYEYWLNYFKSTPNGINNVLCFKAESCEEVS